MKPPDFPKQIGATKRRHFCERSRGSRKPSPLPLGDRANEWMARQSWLGNGNRPESCRSNIIIFHLGYLSPNELYRSARSTSCPSTEIQFSVKAWRRRSSDAPVDSRTGIASPGCVWGWFCLLIYEELTGNVPKGRKEGMF